MVLLRTSSLFQYRRLDCMWSLWSTKEFTRNPCVDAKCVETGNIHAARLLLLEAKTDRRRLGNLRESDDTEPLQRAMRVPGRRPLLPGVLRPH